MQTIACELLSSPQPNLLLASISLLFIIFRSNRCASTDLVMAFKTAARRCRPGTNDVHDATDWWGSLRSDGQIVQTCDQVYPNAGLCGCRAFLSSGSKLKLIHFWPLLAIIFGLLLYLTPLYCDHFLYCFFFTVKTHFYINSHWTCVFAAIYT